MSEEKYIICDKCGNRIMPEEPQVHLNAQHLDDIKNGHMTMAQYDLHTRCWYDTDIRLPAGTVMPRVQL